jgi:hypothetical protein
MPEVVITPEEQQKIKKGYEQLHGKINNSPEGQQKLLNFVDQYVSYKKQVFDQEADKNLVKGIKDFKYLYSPEFNNAVKYKANIPISSFTEPIKEEPTVEEQTAAFNKKAMTQKSSGSSWDDFTNRLSEITKGGFDLNTIKEAFQMSYGPEMMATLEKESPNLVDVAAKTTGYTAKYLADFMSKTVGGLWKGTGGILNLVNQGNANPLVKEYNQELLNKYFFEPGQKVSELAVKESEQKPIGDLFKTGDVEPLAQGISSLGAFMASASLFGGGAAQKLSAEAMTGALGTKLSKLPGFAGKYAPGFAGRFAGQMPGMAPIIAGDAQAEGMRLGLKGQALDNYTAAKTATTLVAFSLVPTNLLTKKFSSEAITKYILNPNNEGVLNQLMKVGTEGLGSAASGVLANVGERAVGNIFSDETGQAPKEFLSPEAFEEYGKSAATMFILHAVPALKQTAGTIVNGANPAYTDAISRMAANSAETFKILDKEVEMGMATKEDADKAKGLILKIKPYVYNAYGNKNVAKGAQGVLAFKEAELEDLIQERNRISQRLNRDLKPGDNVRVYDQFGKVLANSADIIDVNVDPNNPENVVVTTTYGKESIPAKQVVKNEASEAAKQMVEINKKIQNTKNATTQLKNGKFIKGRLINGEQLTNMANSSSTNGRLSPFQVRMMSAESGFYNDTANPLSFSKDQRVQNYIQQIKEGKLVLTPSETDMPIVVGENGVVIDGAKRIAQAIVDSEGPLGQYDNTIEVLRPVTEQELARNVADISELDPEFIRRKWEAHEVAKNPTMEKELAFGEGQNAISFEDAIMQVYQKTLDKAAKEDTDLTDEDIIDGNFVGEEEDSNGMTTTTAKDIHEEFADKYNEATTEDEKKKILEDYKAKLNKKDAKGRRIFNVDPRVTAMRAVVKFAEQYGIPRNELVEAISTGLMPSAPDGVREAVAGYIKWMDKRGMLGKVTSEQMFGNVEAKRREEEKRVAREAINKARKEGQIVNKRERFAKEVAEKIKALIAKRNELPLRSQERAEVDAQIEAIRNEPFKGNKEKTAYYNANRDILDPMVDEALKVEEKPKEEPKEEEVTTTEETPTETKTEVTTEAKPTEVLEPGFTEIKDGEHIYGKGWTGISTEINGQKVDIIHNPAHSKYWWVKLYGKEGQEFNFKSLEEAKEFLDFYKNNKVKRILYHGGAKKIAKLVKDFIQGGFRANYGKGIYFTDSKSKANDYGKELTYLDKNGLEVIDYKEKIDDKLVNQLKKLADETEKTDKELGVYYRKAYEVFKNNIGNEINEGRVVLESEIPKNTEDNWNELLQKLGYDAAQYGYEYVIVNVDKANELLTEEGYDIIEQFEKYKEQKKASQAKPISENLGETVGKEVTLDDGTKGVVVKWEGGAGVTIKFEDGTSKLVNGSNIVEVGEPKQIEVVVRPTEEQQDTATEDLDVDKNEPIGEEPIERENTFANRAEEFDPINNKQAVADLFDKLESLDIIKRNEKNTNCP